MSTAEREAAYGEHRVRKEARVRALLGEHGLEGLFDGMVSCPVERGYRAHATFSAPDGVRNGIRGVDPRLGRVPWEESLWVLAPEGRAVAAAAAGVLLRCPEVGEAVTGFDVRLEYGSGRAHLRLAVRRDAGVSVVPLCEALLAEVPGLLGVAAPSQEVELGETLLRHELLGRTVLAHYLAFFQTNVWLTPELCAEVQRGVEGRGEMVDLYCGVGLHSVLAAREGSRVTGADNNRRAIESACRNAELHGFRDACYVDLPVERFLERAAFEGPDVVFVNPSRGGCSPGVAGAVARWRPARVVLVSCSIDSHVRDTLELVRAGYAPRAVRCFDMFPFSDFLESVSVFAAD